ncbi:hypothetical protein [Bizionia arctica]|uniref:Porin n=1 Tax=Bizionia arctica TaxID=1495645 RepID=A0A917GLV6_9FLAO|nr:hypothetical protein [Bizionia arctica]GGG50669.1 hypothetical protein GCM10010976_22360 [Bizionia arctica]
MKILFIVCFIFTTSFLSFGQERFLTLSSKDSIDNKPQFITSLGANLKLNGYYNVFGGLQESETFNVGAINVFGTDDTSSLNVDMYQSQIQWNTVYIRDNGTSVLAIVEVDFWGGNGHLRLRKAYVETNHWQIGQNWNNFGDEDIWPNIMEWEGPPSGVWVRSPHIKYTNQFKNNKWEYSFSLEAPITDYVRYGELEPLVEETYQNTPDVTAALSYKKDWGHIRFVSLLRKINYKLDDENSSFAGYGVALSGIYKKNLNNFQFQFTGGKGITAYLTTIAGFGYDGYPTVNDNFNATPAIGGWMSYEYFFSKKWHSNVVFGYTDFNLDNVKRYILVDGLDNPEIYSAGDVVHTHYYGIVNVMYEAFERMTFGLELDYGVKQLEANGEVNNQFVALNQKRDAMRISFGFMFYF